MNEIEFIEKNIIAEMNKLGFDSVACNIGAREAVAYYKQASSVSKKGKVFDDCLSHAKLFAKKHALNKK